MLYVGMVSKSAPTSGIEVVESVWRLGVHEGGQGA